ncbi:MAG: hypothetical protein ACLPH3_09320 [Terracidiphilus sp.]
MAANLVYFGEDTCHRLAVLARAGYSVKNCSSVCDLGFALDDPNETEAVLMADHNGHLPQDAIALVRTCSSVALVLFRESNDTYCESPFNLVVPSLTPPEQWLDQIDALLLERRLNGAASALPRSQPQKPQQQAKFLRRDTAQLCENSQFDRSSKFSCPDARVRAGRKETIFLS